MCFFVLFIFSENIMRMCNVLWLVLLTHTKKKCVNERHHVDFDQSSKLNFANESKHIFNQSHHINPAKEKHNI